MKGRILYKEVQYFRNTWIYYLIIGIAVLSLAGGFIPIIIHGGSPESIVGIFRVLLVISGLLVLFGFSKLETTIDEKTIYYRFPPFVNREQSLGKSDISEIFVRKYRPVWEYGGWGYRIRPGKGRAINVSGNIGLQIVKNNGKALLIGTKKSEELKRAIKRLKANWEVDG